MDCSEDGQYVQCLPTGPQTAPSKANNNVKARTLHTSLHTSSLFLAAIKVSAAGRLDSLQRAKSQDCNRQNGWRGSGRRERSAQMEGEMRIGGDSWSQARLQCQWPGSVSRDQNSCFVWVVRSQGKESETFLLSPGAQHVNLYIVIIYYVHDQDFCSFTS